MGLDPPEEFNSFKIYIMLTPPEKENKLDYGRFITTIGKEELKLYSAFKPLKSIEGQTQTYIKDKLRFVLLRVDW